MSAPLPLSGKRILVTRPRAQAADLCTRLAAWGARPILLPTIEVTPLQDTAELDGAIRELAKYQWIIFTSVNGVSAFWDRLNLTGPGDLSGFVSHIAAIGPATARALHSHGITVTLMPDEYVAEGILDRIGDVKDQRILLPRADIAREALAMELQKRGAIVDEIAAYRTLPAVPDPIGLAELRRGVDVITFTSSSTVRNFVVVAGRDTGQALIACIGPITADTARELGLRVDVLATEYTMAGLVGALVRHFSTNQRDFSSSPSR
jgi:uroporphyrinogen-III synthase